MAEDQDVRENRLSLLKMVCDFYQQMADFSKFVFPAK
jgi:glycyl-tRNA synthetase beta subunit